MRDLHRHGLLVAGMHRSGTSALTRMLSLLGYTLPRTLLPADSGNPAGHWESRVVTELNDAVLEAAGLSWFACAEIPSGWYREASCRTFRERAIAAFANEFGEADRLVLKDPRLCRLLPFWLDVLEASGIAPAILLPVRNPVEVAASLEKRDGMDRATGQLLWLRHILDAERDSRGYPRAFLRYEDLLADWRRVIERIEADLGQSWPHHPDDARPSIEQFLSPSYHHHQEADPETSAAPAVAEWIQRTLTVVTRWSRGDDRPGDTAELDAIRDAVAAAEPTLSQAVTSGQQARHDLVGYKAELARTRSRLHETQAALDRQKDETSRLEAALDARTQEVAQQQKELRERKTEAERLQAELQCSERHAAQLATELDALYRSTSWRVTAPLRAIRTSPHALVSLMRQASRQPLLVSHPHHWIDPESDVAQPSLNFDRAERRGNDVVLEGWAFEPDNAVTGGTARLLQRGNTLREVAVEIGLPRDDVYARFGEDTSRRSGFKAYATLLSGRPDRARTTLTYEDGKHVTVHTRLRVTRPSIRRLLTAARHAADRDRITRGVRCLLRGEWRYLYDRLQQLADRHDTQPFRTPRLSDALAWLHDGQAASRHLDRPVDIVVPVYNGRGYLRPLFDSVFRNTDGDYHVIVVDDASPDPEVWPTLEQLAGDRSDVTLLRNETNLGFAGTVNRAAAQARDDFVILNTDTEVPPGWLPRLMQPILRDRRVASTTPFSNAATICSFPRMNADNLPFLGLSVAQIDRSFAQLRGDTDAIELPTGVGFCMGVNGAAWRELGGLDAAAFARGYGEENDWCLRATAAGYGNVLAHPLFVYHKHGGSFDDATRNSYRDQGLRTVLSRYPDYQERVDSFIRADPPRLPRELMIVLLSARHAPSAPVLILDHELGGGANSYRNRLVQTRLAADQPVILASALRADGPLGASVRFRLRHRDQDVVFELDDLTALTSLFTQHAPLAEIFYNNLVKFPRPLRVLDALHAIRTATGARLTVALHDFYPLCPSYTLLHRSGSYCGLPDLETCRACLPRNPYAANPADDTIDDWRTAWRGLLRVADQILCFSEDSRQHLARVYPDCAQQAVVEPHTLDVTFAHKPNVPSHSPLRVGVVGGIGYQKGASIVRDLARYLATHAPDAHLTVIGDIEGGLSGANTTITGAFRTEDLPDLLERHGINVCLFPSIWPETFSYVCDELMALGMPLVCFDLGAPAGRVRHYRHGRVVQDVSAEAAGDALIRLHRKLGQDAEVQPAAAPGKRARTCADDAPDSGVKQPGDGRKTLYLHVGLHKTGSTALQRFLRDNAQTLAAQGVMRPETGLLADAPANFGHHQLAWALRRDRTVDPGLWDTLRQEIADQTCAIVSSEEFEFVRHAEAYTRLGDALPGWEVRPICYLRRQDELLESEYNQYVKNNGGTLPIHEFKKKMTHRLDYRRYLAVLEAAFGRDQIILRIYAEDALDGDIYRDFLTCMGLPDDGRYARPRGTINPSLTPRGLEIMRRLNSRPGDNAERLKWLRQRILRRYRNEAFKTHQLLSDDERAELLATYDASNADIAHRYFGCKRLF